MKVDKFYVFLNKNSFIAPKESIIFKKNYKLVNKFNLFLNRMALGTYFNCNRRSEIQV